MVIKKEHTYSGYDDSISYTMIDNVEKIDVGCDKNHGLPRNYINMYYKNRKDPKEFERLWVDDITVYVCNDQGKTLQRIRPYDEKEILR